MSEPADRIVVDGVEYVRAYPVADGRCPHCGAPWHPWTARTILDLIRAEAARIGAPPKEDHWRTGPDRPSQRLIRDMLGGWSRALLAAGLVPRKRGGNAFWSQAEVVDAMRAHAERTGAPPTYMDWLRATPEHPPSRTILKHYGWNATLRAAGFSARGSHGLLLDAPAARYVNAAPVAAAIASYVAGGSGTFRDIAALADVDESYVTKVASGARSRVNLSFADRVLIALDRSDLAVGLEAA